MPINYFPNFITFHPSLNNTIWGGQISTYFWVLIGRLMLKKHTSDLTQLSNTHGKITLNICNFVVQIKFYNHNPCQQLFIKSSGKLFYASRDNIFQIKVIADIGVLSKMSVLLLLALEIKYTMLQSTKFWFCVVCSKNIPYTI